MEIIKQEKKQALLEDVIDNKKYQITMLDMGSYIGYRSRPWYSTPKPVWKAMSIDASSTEKNGFHYESLVDEYGEITRVILKSEDNSISRIRHYDFGQIEDTIYIGKTAYKYDPNQKNFVDESGNIAPTSQFSQYGMIDSVVALANTMEEEYKLMLDNQKTKNNYDY